MHTRIAYSSKASFAMNRISNWSLQFISDTWIFLTCTHLFFLLQAEVSPPRYDEFLLNWNPSLSLWGHRHKKRKNVWTLIEASRLLWESLGISLELWNYYCSFSWTAQTALWMLLTVTWHAHTDQCVCVCVLCVSVCFVRVCITCKHVYSSCIMCSMFVISTKQTDKQTAVRSLHIHILHKWDAGFQCVTQASSQRYTSLSQ